MGLKNRTFAFALDQLDLLCLWRCFMTKNTRLGRTDKGSLREAKVNQQLVFVFSVVLARLTIDDDDARLSAFDKGPCGCSQFARARTDYASRRVNNTRARADLIYLREPMQIIVFIRHEEERSDNCS